MTERTILISEGFERAVRNFEGSMEEFRRNVDTLSTSIRDFGQAVEKLKMIEGMKAENESRKDRGLAPAYTEDSFFNL